MSISKVNPPFEKGVFVICQKCGKNDSHLELRDKLKKITKETGDAKKVRVTLAGCLGVCPEKLSTVGYFPVEGSAELMTIDPVSDAEEVLKFIKAKAN